MEQVPLSLLPTLPYDPNLFFAHHGVVDACSLFKELLSKKSPAVMLVHGNPRSGKTHFALAALAWAAESRRFPRFVEDISLAERDLDSDSCLVIDDFDRHLMAYEKNNETGKLVSLFEAARHRGAIILATLSPHNFSLEPHVGSRYASAHQAHIQNPSEEEIPHLFHLMARQRGISLGNRKRHFAEKRLRRDIPSVERYLDRVVLLSHRAGKGVDLNTLKSASLEIETP